MRNQAFSLLISLALLILTWIPRCSTAQHAVPMLVNYQGELRDPATGVLAADGTYDMVFRIHDVESGGTAVWEGTYSSGNGNPVEVADGIFSVILGSGVGNALDLSVFNGADRWLEIDVGGETLSPRQRITAVPYSMVSESAQDADTVDGMEGADLEESAEIDADIVAHAAIADAHHARYADSEAVAAMGAKSDTNPLHHDRYADAEAVSAMGTKSDTNPLHHDKTTSFGELTDSASDAQIPATITRDSEVSAEIGTHAAIAGAHHAKTTSFTELTDTASDAQVPASIARDSEVTSEIASHAAIADAHHARYADTEAVGAMGAKSDTNPLNHDKTTGLPWGSITSVPAGFADGIDNDSGGERWSLTGNSGTSPAANFLGTTDNQPLEVRVNNARALRLEPGASPNVIGGYVTNRAEAGAVGATVGGGGEAGFANRVTDDFGTVGGGRNNQAGDDAGTTSDRAYASVGGGAGNLSSGMYATVGGGLGNQAMAEYATIAGGGRLDPGNPLLGNSVFDRYGSIGGGGNNRAGSDDGDPTSSTYATVGGGGTNFATGQGATIGGGFVNEASGFAAAVSGGDSNTAGADYATVGGGWENTASGAEATVGGGWENIASAYLATVGGGWNNIASAYLATVGGGGKNMASGAQATVGGGDSNTASGWHATVGGGWINSASGESATVGGGFGNEAIGNDATVGGGGGNEAIGEGSTVGGGTINKAEGTYSTIAGGGPSDPANAATRNRITDSYGTIGGGGNNQAGDNAGTSSDASFATVGGGHTNAAGAFSATVAGGGVNTANAAWAAIGGGNWNKVTDENGTIAGGSNNQAGDDAGTTQDASYATVGGGAHNIASGDDATVGGGWTNSASADSATVGGGAGNTASGFWATVPGGASNTAAGNYSFAAGWNAKANHAGAFVWGDYQPTDIASTKNNEVTFRCEGGVRFMSGSSGSNQEVSWVPGSSLWNFSSDRNLKENFVEVDVREVLDRVSALPIAEWNFKGYLEKHIGPTAQDFHALFPLAGSDTMIDSGDLHGVALAAVQGLYEIVQEKDEKISCLEKKNTELERRLGVLEKLVEKLTDHQGDQQ